MLDAARPAPRSADRAAGIAPAMPARVGSVPIARALPLPRRWTVRASDLGALAAGLAVLIVLMWVRHGGATELGSPAGLLTATGQLTALLGTYAALLQLVLMSRSPFLDQVVGPDRLAWLHRWLGFATAWLIGAHVVATTAGYALGEGRSVLDQLLTFLGTYQFVLLAGGRLRPVRARHGHLHPRRPAPALVRDLVRPPPLRLPGHRPRVRPPGRRRRRLRRRPGRRRLLGEPLRRHGGARPRLPRRPAARAGGPAPVRRRQRRRGGPGRRLDLRHRSRARPARRPRRAVLPAPPPDAGRLVAGAPVLPVGRAERALPPLHRQGSRRLERRPSPAAAGRDRA